ncbi:hypothetical protein QFC19_003612 [Naganishia cerealis]|uniref:Uncharacterized protein n=1 Tax=Naganishia cerealis TaxID=610337 RepID=A0ACC2W1G3_9TREE|nr:hypothetical protein QFC19_003612 [Naganishia cerealis]
MTTEEEALLLATHHGVQQLSETSRGAWLKSKIKYADEHPFVVPQADVKEGTNELAGGTSRCHSPVKNRRAVFRHLEKIRTRSPPAVPQENTSPVQEKSPSEDTDNVASITVSQSPEIVLSPAPINQSKSQKHSLRGPRSKPGLVKNKNNLSVDIPSATPAKIIVTAASPTTPLNSITLVPPRTISPRAEIDSADPELDDTHADALTRLLFVLLRHPAHPPPYIPEITVELASVLYALYATDGDVDALGEEGQWSMNDYAESDAYWCVRALMGEVALAGSLVPGNQLLEKLAKRVFWADDTLYRLLVGFLFLSRTRITRL